ncbi:non-ribosomal peptide synthetase [Aquisphaera insulae]|uniref:non-ribosomal peptide synthetase n=1 Tax=Aquisphaera insulae TaxID=2712864 RepID=UPI0013EB27D9|nr:non-ribosomal peptide synthetase [Aquisphaera insulae]
MLAGTFLSLWSRLLHCAPSPTCDSFFALGGTSLDALTLQLLVQREFDVKLPLHVVYTRPRFSELLQELRSRIAISGPRLPATFDTEVVREAAVDPDGAVRASMATTADSADRAPRAEEVLPSPENQPLNDAQLGLYIIDRWEPGSTAFIETVAYELIGPVEPARIRLALEAVVARHPSLRTVFLPGTERSPSPSAVVLDRLSPDWIELDLRSGFDAGPPDQVPEAIREQGCRPMDLARGPLVRGLLARRDETSWYFVLQIHHILIDEWSLRIILDELDQLIGCTEGFSETSDAVIAEVLELADFPPLPQSPGPETPALPRATELQWWRDRIEGITEPFPLPFDPRASRSAPSRLAGVVRFALPAGIQRSLQAAADRHQTTLNTILQAAYAVFLHRLTDRPRFLLGLPVSLRDDPTLEHAVGCHVNLLPVVMTVDAGETFDCLITRTRSELARSFMHKDVTLLRIVQSIGGEPARGPQSILQVALVCHDSPLPLLHAPDVQTRLLPWTLNAPKFELLLTLTRDADDWRGAIEFDSLRCSQPLAALLAERFGTLLESLLADPGIPLAAHAPYGPEERHRILAFEQGGAAERLFSTIPDAFQLQVRSRPKSPAVVWDNKSLTYRELDRWSSDVASRLTDIGVCPGDVVAVELSRSPALIAAMLGVLRAGAAYLPLDPTDPPERLQRLREIARPAAVISEGESTPRDALPALEIGLDGPCTEWLSPPRADAAVGMSAPAYVLFTSGSTGTPKAVVVPHRAVLRLVLDPDFMQLDSATVFLHHSPTTFDASTLEVWGPLLNGGRVVLLPPGRFDVLALEAAVRDHSVNTAWLTAALFHLVVDQRPEALAPLQQVLTGGDVVSPDHVRRLLERFPHLTVINGYGPTENTTFTACHPMRADDLATDLFARPLPIGKPIRGTAVRVLDSSGRRDAVGSVGELFTGGDGLALGYLGQPELTAERFVPLDRSTSALWYRTGDLARWRADGSLDFLGRVDRQVKISGYRIEPGEIESAIRSLDLVRDAYVSVDHRVPDRPRLLAWVVPASGPAQGLDPDAILRQLGARLPRYMAQARVIPIDRLPCTPNGKLDPRALPLPPLGDSPDPSPSICGDPATWTSTQRQVASIWSKILNHESFGLDDDFFGLGGNSLDAINLCLELQRVLERPFAVNQFLRATTVRGLGELIASASTTDDPNLPVLLREGGEGVPVFLFPGIDDQVLNMLPIRDVIRAGHALYGMPYRLVRRTGELPSIPMIARAMIQAMDRLGPTKSPCLLGFSLGGHVAYEVARQLREQRRPAAAVLVLDAEPNRTLSIARMFARVVRNGLRALAGTSPSSQKNAIGALRQLRNVLFYEGTPAWFQRKVLSRRPWYSSALGHMLCTQELLVAYYRSRTQPFDGDVSLIRGPWTGYSRTPLPPDVGWSRFARRVDAHIIPAEHCRFFDPPHITTIGQVLNNLLKTASAEFVQDS